MPPRRKRSGRKQKPSGQLVCCPDDLPGEPQWECRGDFHAAPTLTHKCCATKPDPGEEFFCDRCLEEIHAAKPFTQPSGTSAEEPASSQEIGEGEYGEILDSRINDLKGNRIEYLITRPNAQLETWVTAKEVPAHRLADFEEGFVGVTQRGDEDSSQYATQAVHQPLDLEDDSLAADEAADNPFWKYLQNGYWSVANATYAEAALQHAALRDIPRQQIYRNECVAILASLPHKALMAIMGSGLWKRKLVDEELREGLREIRKRSVGRPNCYILEFCNTMGVGPTVGEMREMCNIAERYAWPDSNSADDAELAIKIDEVKFTLKDREKEERYETNIRRYLSSGPKDNTRKNLRVLLDNLYILLSGLSDDDARVPFLMKDVGYTDDGPRRIEKDHSQHKSSNDLMNLWEAISMAFFKEQKYRMRGHVIYLCCKKTHAAISEVLFSVISQSYIATGKGFNGVAAGVQQRSAESYSNLEQWNEWMKEHMFETPFFDNMTAERNRVIEYNARHDALKETLARKRHELAEIKLARLNEIRKLQQDLKKMLSVEWLNDGQPV